MIKRCLTSLVATLIVCFLACSSASARVCFLPDSTDCGEGDVAGSGNVDVPCQYSNCPAYNTKYQTCYTERIYNNGGVNVECKQVKCILSKSECEKQEANPNSSQCCNFDSASGCYYMGSCKLCNRDVYDSEKNLGEGYDCHPCKDKNGTFYNCTAKEKECKDINPKYTSSCGDSQIAKEVEGIKDSHGNQCYTCEDKPTGCTYEYTRIDDSNGHGDSTFSLSLYSDFQNRSQNTRGASYYWKGPGSFEQNYDYSGFQMYSKIDKNSKTCYDKKGTLRYETICPGTARVACKKDLVPNGCSSEQYAVYRLTVESMDFGDCVCDTSKGHYDTDKSCSDATSLKCTSNGQCYQTCEAAGMYSSEDACKTDTKGYSVKCTKVGNCYKQEMDGFLIKIYEHAIRSFSCRYANNPGYSMYTYAYLSDIRDDDFPGGFAKTVKGEVGRSLDDSLQQFPAGTYYLCFGTHVSSQYNFPTPTPSVKAVYVDRYPAVIDTIIDVDKTPLRNGCAKVKFEAGTTYSVKFSYTGVSYADVHCSGN